MKPRRLQVAALTLLAVAGCNNRNTVVIPNRVLDRPTDLALGCVFTDGEHVRPTSVDQCLGSIANCGSTNVDQLVGFITNSERNEVALFRKCGGELVDMDREAPGFQFVPVGSLPTSITMTTDGCSAVVANAGSCDLSVLDAPALAAAAVEVDLATPPSAHVSTLVPRRASGEPLGVRPGQVVAAPPELSQSAGESSEETGGDDLSLLTDGVCQRGDAASVYVTFPSCHLVAEVDLVSGRILQSRQLLVDAVTGEVDVVDAGSDPECPVECPHQFDGEVPDVEAEADGVFPSALALVRKPTDTDLAEADPAESEILDSTLFVGGVGSERIIEIPLADGVFSDAPLQLELAGSSGIQGIRPTPPMYLALDGQGATPYQFLYVLAGDGSTRVVKRDLAVARDAIGVQCDTQLDPTAPAQIEAVCNPATDPGDHPPGRRAFAIGPGIRAPNGATVMDWSFQRVTLEAGESSGTSPFTAEGVVGIGVTNFGRVVFSTFGQFKGGSRSPPSLDPLELYTDIRVLPHMLWPSLNPASGDPTALPRLQDQVPSRLVPGDATLGGGAKVLAPTLRQVDQAYSELGVTNVDLLSNPDLGQDNVLAIYKNAVARVLPRDLREWRSGDWRIRWEGEIPGASGSTGQVECAKPGNYGATCLEGSRLVDTASDFCDDGVLAGDKIFIFGCTDDSDCGLGQICLKEGSQALQGSGICVSESAAADPTLAEACRHFIHDPCGTPLREFLITRATRTALDLQSLDVPESSVLWQDDAGVHEEVGRLLCAEAQPEGGCESHADCAEVIDEGPVCASDDECPRDREGNASVCDPESKRCQVAHPYCYDGRCRRACDAEREDCVLRRLPGPTCFAELARYQISARNAFVVSGPGVYSFLDQRVKSDAEGECYEDPAVSTLLTSRIRLDVDADGLLQMPICPAGTTVTTDAPNPCLITQVRPPDPSAAVMGSDALTASNPARLFHLLSYGDAPVPAIRYANPAMSMILDLTSPLDLSRSIPGFDEVEWPADAVPFRRSRIPRSYTLGFTTLAGYTPYNDGVVLGTITLAGPTRVVNAPETGIVYVVDSSGRGGAQGIRGQVMRVLLNPTIIGDENFVVR